MGYIRDSIAPHVRCETHVRGNEEGTQGKRVLMEELQICPTGASSKETKRR